MRKKSLALAVAGMLASPLAALAQDAPASPLSFNVGLVSDYLFRGVSQTHGDPALQGGVDYAHPSGFYVGAWASTITWVKDFLGRGSLEIDVYGGYKNAFGGGDWTYDVGYIAYNYPRHGDAVPTVLANPNTQEIYGALGWKWVTAKYSYATSKHFIGWYGGTAFDQKTRGSQYLELNASYDLGGGWALTGHVGRQKVKNVVAVAPANDADYTDWKIGVAKDVGFGVVGLAYSDTNAKGSCVGGGAAAGSTSLYCWGTDRNTRDFRDVAKGTVLLSFVKTF
jgi:uncharacterized protein (TIGR02001 family)